MMIKLKRNITVHKLDNKLSLYDGEKSVLYTCNESAEFIINALKLGWSKHKIIADLQEKFGAKKVEAEEDYNDITLYLAKNHMIE